MMKKISLLLILLAFTSYSTSLIAQNSETQKATFYGTLDKPIVVPSLAQQIKDGTFIGIDPNEEPKLGQPKKQGANITVPGKGLPKGDDPLIQNYLMPNKHRGKSPILVFEANTSNYTPSDPTGAVGPDHFVGAWNTGFRIFDKEGVPLTAPASLSTLFPGNNLGDPIVLYDVQADRFIITEFDNSPNGFNVAVCQGPDPVNDGWYIYTTGFGTGSFPDYTKFSIWSDGYYVTANINASNKVFAIERDEMLLGNPSQFVGFPLTGIATSGFYSPQFFNVTDGELPPAGNAQIVYLQDDAWSGVSTDHLKIWTVNVDWDNVGTSTISSPVEIITAPFISVFDGGSFSNVPQPNGPDQDVLQAIIMNQAQYRRFNGYNSAIFNFVVDTDGSGGELAGIRWYELRQDADGDPWTIYQEGTYISPYNNKHTFSGSMAMDGQGNIGMGYTTCSQSEQIGIYYTGRYASDTLGQMTVDETLIAQSTSNNPSNRLADYVHLTLDPTNDNTFWHIAEYFVSSQRRDVVGVFQISTDIMNDIGILGITSPVTGYLSEEEEITIALFNYGLDTLSDIPVNYQIDGGDIVSEIMAGPISTGESMAYTFTQTANLGILEQTYEITSFTSLLLDENLYNDTVTKSVTYLQPNDIGVTAIVSPTTGIGLTAEEEVRVVISNFGYVVQNDFDVTFNLDDYIHTEQVPGPLSYPFPTVFTFAETVDLSTPGTYNLSAYTSLPDDVYPSNDTTTKVIVNTMCQPESICIDGHGFYLFQLGNIDNITDCSLNGYGDYTDLSTELANNSVNELTITTHFGDQFIKVWIDFNDNFLFENDEVVVDNYIIAPGQGSGVFTETMDLTIPAGANLGQHIMRAKSNWNDSVPDNACEGTQFGETEDYTADLVQWVGIEDRPLSNTDLVIKSLGNNRFEVLLETSEVTETLIINLHNVLGRKLAENRIENINGRYVYDLDLSYAKPGAYIIRLGTLQYGKVKRIIVK